MQQQVIEFLSGVRQGAMLVELYEALTLAVEAEHKTRKPAEVRLVIKIEPAAQGDDLPVFVKAAISTKLPSVDSGSTIFYISGDDAVLSRRDPRQQDMFALKTVGESRQEAERYADHG